VILAALRKQRLPNWVLGYAAALGAVMLVSLFIGLVIGQINLASVSMLYLLAGRRGPLPRVIRRHWRHSEAEHAR